LIGLEQPGTLPFAADEIQQRLQADRVTVAVLALEGSDIPIGAAARHYVKSMVRQQRLQAPSTISPARRLVVHAAQLHGIVVMAQDRCLEGCDRVRRR
jgi:hypothetical protein